MIFYYFASLLILGIISAWKQWKCWNYFIHILGYYIKQLMQVGMCFVTDVDKKLGIDGRIQKSVSSSSLSVTQGNQEGLNAY